MTKTLLIQKYGGTSLASIDRIKHVAAHIKETVVKGNSQVVVVPSAMGHYTDYLWEQAHNLSSRPPKRECDMLLTSGERISASLLAIALDALHIPAMTLTGSQSGILTNGLHGNAQITKILGDRIRQGLFEGKVVIVAGFQGVCPETKDITTLGRGGSDLTAVALTAVLKAAECQIYTDVDGVYSWDPRLGIKPYLLRRVSWNNMSRLAWAGAGVLHHRAAFVAGRYQVPVSVRSSMNLTCSGTRIIGKDPMENGYITGIAHRTQMYRGKFLFTQQEDKRDFKTLNTLGAQMISYLWELEESPAIFKQHYENNRLVIDFVLPKHLRTNFNAYIDLLKQNLPGESQLSEDYEQETAVITVIGDGFRHCPQILNDVHAAITGPLFDSEMKDHFISIAVEANKVSETMQNLQAVYEQWKDSVCV